MSLDSASSFLVKKDAAYVRKSVFVFSYFI